MANDLGVSGRDVSWTKEDRVLLWQEINRLHERGLSVELHEQSIEKWFAREKIRKMRKSMEEKREEVFKVWRTNDLRQHGILKRLPASMRHIEHRERGVIVRMMKSAVLELKYHQNLVLRRQKELKKIRPTLKMDLQAVKGPKKAPEMGIVARRSYVKFQDASTHFKAAQYVNVSYKKIINFLEREIFQTKAELQRGQRDSAEMKSLTAEMEIFREKSLNRLTFFSQEFQRRYGAFQANFESHLERCREMQERHAEMQHKIEQEIPQIPPSRQRSSARATIADLEIRVEEAERAIRSLQNATRCPELGGIEARFERQLPAAEHFMVDAERLREARVSLIARRKEIQLQHDRYVQDTDAEFRSLDHTIDDLRQKIEVQRQRQLKHCQEVEELLQHKIELISHLSALKFLLKRDNDLTILGSKIDSQEEYEIENFKEGKKLIRDIMKQCKILVKQFDFNLSKKEVIRFEHLHQDKILERISPRTRFEKLDYILKEAEKNFAESLGNVKFDSSDVPTRKDIKRMSRVIVMKNMD